MDEYASVIMLIIAIAIICVLIYTIFRDPGKEYDKKYDKQELLDMREEYKKRQAKADDDDDDYQLDAMREEFRVRRMKALVDEMVKLKSKVSKKKSK